jgi:hypothetical protein
MLAMGRYPTPLGRNPTGARRRINRRIIGRTLMDVAGTGRGPARLRTDFLAPRTAGATLTGLPSIRSPIAQWESMRLLTAGL